MTKTSTFTITQHSNYLSEVLIMYRCSKQIREKGVSQAICWLGGGGGLKLPGITKLANHSTRLVNEINASHLVLYNTCAK